MMKAAWFESGESQLSNATTLIARGVHYLKIQAVLESALDLEGWRQNKRRLEIPCDVYFAETDIKGHVTFHGDRLWRRGRRRLKADLSASGA